MQPIAITRLPRSQREKTLPAHAVPMAPLPLPRELYLESTNRCNERCDQCPRTHLDRETDRDLTLADVRMIVDQLPAIDRAVLHGLGEPMLNPELPEIVAYLRGRGAYVLFNTNATALSARMGDRLLDAGLNELRISLDGATPETYGRVRGVTEKTLPRVLRNVAAFVRQRDARQATLPRLSFWFTAMRENLHELPMLPDLARETGVTEVYVQRLIYFGEGLAKEEQALFRRARTEEIDLIARTEAICQEYGLTFKATGSATPLEYITNQEENPRPWSPCQRPYKLAYISAIGNVYSCCFAPFHPGPAQTRILGNVFSQPFDAIWNGPRYTNFRTAFASDTPWDHCAGCGSKWSL